MKVSVERGGFASAVGQATKALPVRSTAPTPASPLMRADRTSAVRPGS